MIGQIITSNPFEGERYYLWILLNHIRYPLSFDDLKIVNGVMAPTFHVAATMHDLLEIDSTLEDCLYKASLYQIPFSLKWLFIKILVYCNPTNPIELWLCFEQDILVDFKSSENFSTNVRLQVLQCISCTLKSMRKYINSFNQLGNDIYFYKDHFESKDIDDELAVVIPEEYILTSKALNNEWHVYNLVLENIFSNEAVVFFVDSSGGTWKTFLYKAFLAIVRSKQLVALTTISSSVVASILPRGRIVYSRFKIILDIDKHRTCSVNKQSALASLLRVTN